MTDDLNHDAVNKLAIKYSVKPDYNLYSAIYYYAADGCESDTRIPVIKQQKEVLDHVIESANNLVCAIDSFTGTIGNLSQFMLWQIKGNSVQYPQIKYIDQMRIYVREDAMVMKLTAQLAKNKIERPKGGAYKKVAYERLIERLITIYLCAVENPTLMLRKKNQADYGEFFNFINDCLCILGITKREQRYGILSKGIGKSTCPLNG
jgi:hypothetical protein